MTVREDAERGYETRGSLPPALPPEALPVEVDETAERYAQKPTKTRLAVAAAMVIVVALQLAWIIALVFWLVHLVV